MIKIHIVTAIIVLLVMEYLRRQYIDKRVAEEVKANLNRNGSTSAYDSMRYWQCITGQLGPDCKP